MSEWQPIETAPKDGTVIWGYLYHSGIRKLAWVSPEESAYLYGGSPDEYVGIWVDQMDSSEDWAPRHWLPLEAIPEPPK